MRRAITALKTTSVPMIKYFLLFLIHVSLFSKPLEEYFRKIEQKGSEHRMKNIDFIYMINLDERPEKFEQSSSLLALYGIFPYRFSAVNGWKLSLEEINDVGVLCDLTVSDPRMATCYVPEDDGQPIHEPMTTWGRTYFCHCMARGSIGILLSHLSILQDAYDSGYETIWVMEDDVAVCRNPNILSELIEGLDAAVGKDGWDILFTDRDTKNNNGQYVPNTGYAWIPNYSPPDPGCFARTHVINGEFRQVGARFGAYSMIFRRSGLSKLLTFVKQRNLFIPYDIEYALPPGIRLFTVLTDVVSTQPGSPSDNGGPNYLNRRVP